MLKASSNHFAASEEAKAFHLFLCNRSIFNMFYLSPLENLQIIFCLMTCLTDVKLQMYKMFVRLHLEYCVQLWSPFFRTDVIKLGRVLNRFTWMLLELEGLGNKDRLDCNKEGLFSHERMRLSLVEVHKIMSSMVKMDGHILYFPG